MKVFLLGGNDRYLILFRGALIREMAARGCDVIAAAPPESEGAPEEVRALGATWEPIDFRRTGMNPLADLRMIFRVRAALRRHRPDLFLAYTIKPAIYGALAARLAGTPRIATMVTGLGYVFGSRGMRGRLIGVVAAALYRIALRFCHRVFFQNPDDMAFFTRRGLVDADRAKRIRGSGVELDHFTAAPPPATPYKILMVTRLLRDKGVGEFVEAARLVKPRLPDAEFHLVGPLDPNPTAVKREEIHEWERERLLTYHGYHRDVRPFLRECGVYVLPSYSEGTPRSVLEAMATGRPVVTTDVPGCRETVFLTERGRGQKRSREKLMEGENGFLVPPGDARALSDALLFLLETPGLPERMGRRGRELAEAFYDVRDVNAHILEELGVGETAII